MKSAAAVLLFAIVLGSSGAGAAERNPSYLFNPGNHVDVNGVVRDRGGRPIGRIEPAVEGNHVLRDNDGRHIGNVVPGFNANELVIRDNDGRRQGTLERR